MSNGKCAASECLVPVGLCRAADGTSTRADRVFAPFDQTRRTRNHDAMSKRGRDEGALFAAPLTPNTASVADEKAMRLSRLRVHLNASFLEDLRRKMEQDPARVFDMEVNSYLKHSQKLRVSKTEVKRGSSRVQARRPSSPSPIDGK